MAGGISSDGEDEATELLAEVAAELREQEAEEANNLFVSVKKLRNFVKTETPVETVNVCAIMCVESSVWLDNNRGSRVSLVDGFMQPHLKGYVQMLDKNDRRDSRIFKLTVWDPKNRSTGRPQFSAGAVYKMKKIHSLKFYHESLQGCLQAVGGSNPGLIEEFPDFEAAKRSRLVDGTHERCVNANDEFM